MDKYIDDNLTDLNILALLPEGVKISVRSGRIVHETIKDGNFLAGAINSVKRWVFNDNRKSGVQEIYTIVELAVKILRALEVGGVYHEMYMDILPKVATGIENYKRTYKDDAFVASRCNIIIRNIKALVKPDH